MALGTPQRGKRVAFVWRVEMVRPLAPAPPAPELPAGYAFARFEPRDLAGLAAVEHRAFADTPDARAFQDQLASPAASLAAWRDALAHGRMDREATVVLKRGEELCGFAQGFAGRGVGYLNSLAVLPEHRGGTGRALVLEVLRRFRARGLRMAALTVTAGNERALALYEHLGFQEVGWSIATFLEDR